MLKTCNDTPCVIHNEIDIKMSGFYSKFMVFSELISAFVLFYTHRPIQCTSDDSRPTAQLPQIFHRLDL